MNRRHLIELFVIDAMADDYEDLEQIEKSVELRTSKCHIPFSAAEVAVTLQSLIARGFVKAFHFQREPDNTVKQFPFRGVVKELDDQHRIAKIHLDHIKLGGPFILQHPVKDPVEYSELKTGDKVRGVVFVQYSDSWFGAFEKDDDRVSDDRVSTVIPFSVPVEVPGVPNEIELKTLAYGLSPKGRAVQDSDAPGWPFDDNDVLIPGWTLDAG